MADLLQHGQHPDADQLNAFMEKASPEHERLATLAHLAECEECRNIVFLAQKDLLPEVQAETDSQPWWTVWRRPVLAAGVSFACLVVLVVSVKVQRAIENQNKPMYDARNQATNLPSPSTQSQVAHAVLSPQEAEAAKTETLRKLQRESVAPTTREHSSRAVREPSAAPAVGGVPSGVGGVAGGIMGGLGLAPRKPVGGPQQSQFVPSPPTALAMRKQEAAPAAQASAAPAMPADLAANPINGRGVAQFPKTDGPLRLTIEHGQGADNGLSVLRGTIRDSAGAVIPKATINLRGLSGQANTNAASDAGGEFAISALLPGLYEIEVVSVGFQPLKQRINLQARDLAQIDPVLPVGSSAQTVAVTAAAPLMQTESADSASGIKKFPESTFVSQATANGTLLGVDPSGALFRKGAGDKNWKKVKAKWHGAVVKISLNPESQPGDPSATPVSFLITTNSGEAWTSPDGRHWKRR